MWATTLGLDEIVWFEGTRRRSSKPERIIPSLQANSFDAVIVLTRWLNPGNVRKLSMACERVGAHLIEVESGSRIDDITEAWRASFVRPGEPQDEQAELEDMATQTHAESTPDSDAELIDSLKEWKPISDMAHAIASAKSSLYTALRQESDIYGLTFEEREVDAEERDEKGWHHSTTKVIRLTGDPDESAVRKLRRRLDHQAHQDAAARASARRRASGTRAQAQAIDVNAQQARDIMWSRISQWQSVPQLAENLNSSKQVIYQALSKDLTYLGLNLETRDATPADRRKLALSGRQRRVVRAVDRPSNKVLDKLVKRVGLEIDVAAIPARAPAPVQAAAPQAAAPQAAPAPAPAAQPAASNGVQGPSAIDKALLKAAEKVVVARDEEAIEELGRQLFLFYRNQMS